MTNDDEVICPACCHSFRAIPINVQQLMLDAGFEPPFVATPTQPVQSPPLTDDQINAITQAQSALKGKP